MIVVADSKFPVGMISEEPGLDSDDDNPVPPSPSPRQPNLTLHLYLGLIGAQDIPRERAISTSIFLGLKPGEAADERLRKSTSSSTSEWMYKKWKEWEFCGETDWFRESAIRFTAANSVFVKDDTSIEMKRCSYLSMRFVAQNTRSCLSVRFSTTRLFQNKTPLP